MDHSHPPVPVVIVGGGATGAMVAWHLLRQRPDLGKHGVTIIEPRHELGAGQAYGTHDPQHRINVPAARMSLDTQKPSDFRDWLDLDALAAIDPDAFLPSGDLYPARAQFGRYLAARLAPYLETGRLRHVRGTLDDVTQTGTTWHLSVSDGPTLDATLLVIATTHPAPSLPAPLTTLEHDKRVVSNPWRDDALARIAPQESVAIIGTGLTMADIVASLSARGHKGRILAFSRRGLRPRAHAPQASALSDVLLISPAPTALALLRNIRASLSDHADLSWHEIIDAVRKQGRQLWGSLHTVERRRLIRHLRPFWDVHRFRIAPQVDRVLETRLAEESLALKAARLINAEATDEGVTLTLRPRGGTEETHLVDHVINTTGPDHAGIVHRTPYLRALAALRVVEPDPTGLGIHTCADHHARVGMQRIANLLIAGPLSRGQFGELMGLPEVTESAQSVARHLAALLPLTPVLIPDEVEP
ncbi:FAD/NAD(P)-binding protein [Asaia astilbis]|uniref:FAD/NAD(P)-binding protein n=1 Tax=Asaia astilbis TaxID=610244 RepID=UPI00046E5EF3|nr:FAD-dependent oxidoreductase [Asaia astilbis]